MVTGNDKVFMFFTITGILVTMITREGVNKLAASPSPHASSINNEEPAPTQSPSARACPARFLHTPKKEKQKGLPQICRHFQTYQHQIAMGRVRITSCYPEINGSHFGLPPSSIHQMTGLGGKMVRTVTYSHRPIAQHDLSVLGVSETCL